MKHLVAFLSFLFKERQRLWVTFCVPVYQVPSEKLVFYSKRREFANSYFSVNLFSERIKTFLTELPPINMYQYPLKWMSVIQKLRSNSV